jgi:DNA (cytosine-5)-methyltransferase 1
MTMSLAEYYGRPVVVDAFCCQGGASSGLVKAGFRVIGIEKNAGHLKRYPYEFVQGDVLAVLPAVLQQFRPVAVGGSPPCQRYSDTQVIQGNEHPDLIAPFRELVEASGLPYWIENVGGAVKQGELRADLRLCGLMFGLKTDRHRFFETNFPVTEPPHPVGPEGREDHRDMPKTKMGRKFVEGELRQYVGNFHGPDLARLDLGVPWMTREAVSECIPPAYGEFIGEQLALHLGLEEGPWQAYPPRRTTSSPNS